MNETGQWVDGWWFRVEPPSQTEQKAPPIVFLHGWTGDEQSMDLFSRYIHESSWRIFPRGPVQARPSGYGWATPNSDAPALSSELVSAAEQLHARLLNLSTLLPLPKTQFNFIGFSQGAALLYGFLSRYGNQIRKAAFLSGFLPPQISFLPAPSSQRPDILITHGSKDETIPVAQAYQASATLRALGYSVSFCEGEIGHKLSATCLASLQRFISENPRSSSASKGENSQQDSDGT